MWAEPRPTDVPVRVWRDWVLVAVLVPAAIAEGVLRPGLPMRALSVAVTLGLVATLLWRRTRPLVMVVIAFAVTGLVQALTAGAVPVQYAGACVLLLPYALYRWGSGREIVIGSAVVFAKIGLSAVPRLGRASDAMAGVAFMSAMMAMGAAYRFRARARVRALDQVRLRERENLARELHDTVAHHVSAIAIRAQAGLATAAMAPEAATEAATEALRVVEAEASRALAEMRDMVASCAGTSRPTSRRAQLSPTWQPWRARTAWAATGRTATSRTAMARQSAWNSAATSLASLLRSPPRSTASHRSR